LDAAVHNCRPSQLAPEAMATSAGSDSKKFHPPKWCRPPKDPQASAQMLCIIRDGAPKPLDVIISTKAVYTMGRADSGVDIQLTGALVSRLHAAICQDAKGNKFLVDLRSTCGTFLDGKRLEPHKPVQWLANGRACFGSGTNADVLELMPPLLSSGNGSGSVEAVEDGKDEIPATKKQRISNTDSVLTDLYGDLPEATVNECVPLVEDKKRVEPITPPPREPKAVIFLDIDGVLRAVHGRTDFAQNVRTMDIGGRRVALMGDGAISNDNLAGIDFWPQAMHALKHIVQKTQAGVVLSSDWRKQEQLMEGVNNQLIEYGMPKLYGSTPDLDMKNVAGVVKALHANVREKRAKEIRKWLRKHPNIERWVAIDDMDLTASRKDEALHLQSGSQEPMPFLDLGRDFVKCSPAVGLTMDLAKLAVAMLIGVEVSAEDLEAAYGQ